MVDDPKECYSSGTFDANGVTLFEQRWVPPTPRAHVLLYHGYGEHSGRYGHVAERLNAEGFALYAYDQRGHGKSPGRMGHIPSFDALVEDAEAFRRHVFAETPDEPLFVMGHSMGGLVLAAWALRYAPEDPRGLVFSSPGVKADDSTSPILRMVVPLLAKIAPHMTAVELPTDGLSRVPEVETRYNGDPLVYHGTMGTRSAYEMMRTIDFVQAHLSELRLPLLVFHGTADRLVTCEAGRSLHEGAASDDKTLKIYEGGYHELFNDTVADTFFEDLLSWLNARV